MPRQLKHRKYSDMTEKLEYAKRFIQALRANQMATLPNQQIGKLLGVSSTSIFHYKNGEKIPSIENAIIQCKKLDVSLEWLMTGRGPMQCSPTENQDTYVSFRKIPSPAIQEIVDDLVNLDLQLNSHKLAIDIIKGAITLAHKVKK